MASDPSHTQYGGLGKPTMRYVLCCALVTNQCKHIQSWRQCCSCCKSARHANLFQELAPLSQAFMWQMGFMADPRVLKDLEHQLKVDERVLRHMVFR